MAVELEIRDGDPSWWLSPDIWTVPGNNPEGTPGTPIVGETCYLWAKVTNKGTSSVTNAVVRFYWANPSVGFDRDTANLVGSSNVNLSAGESADVLCLSPWIPEYVNNGHECVLAEAFHSSLDPLPATSDFNVPTDRHVAQLNLSVAQAVRGFFALPIVLYNTERVEKSFAIRAYQGRLGELKPLAQQLGLDLSRSEGKLVQAAFVDMRCPTEDVLGKCDSDTLEVVIPENGSRFTTLIGRIEGETALVHVGQFRNDQLVGGLSVLVVC
ncbi:MAG: hypothetical protein ACE1ZA_01785 [Pseudomonadales bacterium]